MMIRKQWWAVLIVLGLLTACGGQAPAPAAALAPAVKVEVDGGSYTNVWNLDGGMAAWEQWGLPLKER